MLPSLFDISTSEIDGIFKSLPKHADKIDAVVVILKRIVWRACTFWACQHKNNKLRTY